MDDRFVVRIGARGYEVDANGHVAASVLLQYAQHARWECLRAAGIDQASLRGQGIGPVSLEQTSTSGTSPLPAGPPGAGGSHPGGGEVRHQYATMTPGCRRDSI
jgi:hypothetical protein